MTLKVYGQDVICKDCGSDNTVEQTRHTYLDATGHSTYPVVVCLTCGWEDSL